MDKAFGETVAKYFYGDRKWASVYACYPDMEAYDNRRPGFWDVYDENGVCLNEGDPFYAMPTWGDVLEFYIQQEV